MTWVLTGAVATSIQTMSVMQQPGASNSPGQQFLYGVISVIRVWRLSGMEWLFIVIPILFIVLVMGAVVRALVLDYRERGEGEVSLPGRLEGAGPSMDARQKAAQRTTVRETAPVTKKSKAPMKRRKKPSGGISTLESLLESQGERDAANRKSA